MTFQFFIIDILILNAKKAIYGLWAVKLEYSIVIIMLQYKKC